MEDSIDRKQLRTGFTTGACATAGCAAACTALFSGSWPNPVTITLPRGKEASFDLESMQTGNGWAEAAIRKDAGDDPDVTHGALIVVRVLLTDMDGQVEFEAGSGVGVVTKSGLPIEVGEPAINPVPRRMMTDTVRELVDHYGVRAGVRVSISVPGGEELALRTWNPRLGIKGGLSILGTTGIVRPYSCSAWIASIHRGIDVARSNGCDHVIGSTGSVSEQSAARLYELPEYAMLDMGDFVGGMLKYLRRHPVPLVTIAGGFGKLSKLAQGAADLHSRRSSIDFDQLAELAGRVNPDLDSRQLDYIRTANTSAEVLEMTGGELADLIASRAAASAMRMLDHTAIKLEVIVFDRDGRLRGSSTGDAFLDRRRGN